MVQVYAARTLPVNPPEAPFMLPRNLLWQALQRKIRRATEFVPLMKECTVVSDRDNVVVRKCVLEHADKSVRHMREEVTSRGEQSIIFRQEDGSTTTNLLSNGANNDVRDLQLTYIFEWLYPDVEEGGAAHREAIEKTSMMALTAVRESINQARRLVKEKTIQ